MFTGKEEGKMKRFNPERACVKCGNEGRKLVQDGKTVGLRAAADTQYTEKTDSLIRTCRRCSYQWLEECVDKE